MLSRNWRGSTLTVDDQYDLPFAIAYGKLTWFLWVPLDSNHRHWKKINENLEIVQKNKGSPVKVIGDNVGNRQCLFEKLGLWYDHTELLENQPNEIQVLFKMYPIRFPKASMEDFELLFTAAILSPRVTWEDNTLWTRLLYIAYYDDLSAIADTDPSELDYVLQETMSETKYESITKLRRLGYHAQVLVKAFQDYRDKLDGRPDDLYKMSSSEAKRMLLGVYGIGPKIAMYLVQATHGDLSAPCIDTHVHRIARSIGFMKPEMVPYNANMCERYIGECKQCPFKQNCGAYQLSRYSASTLVSALLYFLGSTEKPY